MLAILDPLRNTDLCSVTVKMFLAVICGGMIGIEREYKRRPAGFRTHMLICLGAAMTTLTSQYLLLDLGYQTDITRLGAQVVAGVGFIGAGTIIVSRHQRVKGLTTAAGLWTTAIIGLTLGAGFYEGAIVTTGLLLLAEVLFSRLEYRIVKNAPEVNLYVEFAQRKSLDDMLRLCQSQHAKTLNLEITRSADANTCAIFTLRLSGKTTAAHLLEQIAAIDGITAAEEL